MPTITLYLDNRVIKKNGTCPLKFVIRNYGTVVYMKADIDLPPQCWKDGKVVTSRNAATDALLPRPPKLMNILIQQRLLRVQEIAQQICGWKSNMTASVLREKIIRTLNGQSVSLTGEDSDILFMDCVDEYTSTLEKKKTIQLHNYIKNYIRKNIPHAEELALYEMDEDWIRNLMGVMKKGTKTQKPLSANSILNIMCLIKATWHYAQRKKYVSKDNVPFANIKLPKPTIKSRALSIEEMREVWYHEGNRRRQSEVVGRDMFVLSFCLCGLNMADLYKLRESDIRGGRLECDRQKTGVHINIKIEPEAQAIIDKYKKDGYLIGKVRKVSADNTTHAVNKGLRHIRSGLTMYWARHTWVSLAVELDIPDRTVFMGIAHRQGKASDETYVTMRNRKLDIANRRVIDYVLGKIEPEY